jgi:hypothetical protein
MIDLDCVEPSRNGAIFLYASEEKHSRIFSLFSNSITIILSRDQSPETG